MTFPQTSTVHSVLLYLTATFQNAATLGKATPPVSVYDGPHPSEAFEDRVLWVGVENPENIIALSATATQNWVGPGNRWRNEQLSIRLAAQAYSGVDAPSARAITYGIIAAAENLLRADANLGGNVLMLKPGSNQHQLQQWAAGEGFVAKVAWRCDAMARIGSSN